MRNPLIYRLGASLARLGQLPLARHGWIHKIPAYPASQWTKERDFPALAPKSFRARWKKM
jgi:L-lactate dehydrogenase complex protein LldF